VFYTGAQAAAWLGRASTPLMLSRSRLQHRRTPLPAATAPWYLDSAAFTELERHGQWTVPAAGWAALADRWGTEAGQLAHVATQDWLCTPAALHRTGLTVAEHQARTTASYLDLQQLAPHLPWVPTLQGWQPDDYLRHAELYDQAGVPLPDLPLVGIGSIAMRQHTPTAAWAVTQVHHHTGARLHAYGAKDTGLRSWGWAVASADSMARPPTCPAAPTVATAATARRGPSCGAGAWPAWSVPATSSSTCCDHRL
jgi:hypothetical protein